MSKVSTGYVTSMRIPPELYAGLESIAKDKDVSLNVVIIAVLNRYVQNAGYPGLKELRLPRRSRQLKFYDPSKSVHTSIWLQHQIRKPLGSIAEGHGYSLSFVIRSVLEDYVRKVKSGEIEHIGDPVPEGKAPKGRGLVRPLPPLTLGSAPDPTPAPSAPEPPWPVTLTPQELAAMWGVEPPAA